MSTHYSKSTSENDPGVPYHAGANLLLETASSIVSGNPRLAKDDAYASEILSSWKSDVNGRLHSDVTSLAKPIVYRDANDCPLYGYLYRPHHNDQDVPIENLPGLILFHTGAGPQDIFLRWKADALVTDTETFPNGVVVLIADILGDETGWAWETDRSRYESVASILLVPDENGKRSMLQSRVRAAVDTLREQSDVDPSRIGIVGFCLGGHPILELGRMPDIPVKAMVSFHGVFGSVHKFKLTEADVKSDSSCQVLICTGNDDPFVPKEDVLAAQDMFERLGHHCATISFEDTKHGFTNPAQSLNTNPAFDYNANSYRSAWNAMCKLLEDVLK
jgi:dienelactone hydrolase